MEAAISYPSGCPDCGTPFAPGGPPGTCVVCLLRLAEAEADRRSAAGLDETSGACPRQLNDYRLLREIGRGGMGVVFEAEQISLKRNVAVKLILAGEFASEVEIARFHEEADALAMLDHPNIVPIYAIGEEAGQHFYSMRLLDGGSLEERFADFAGDPHRTVDLLKRIARAVHTAHQAGILHRDLKAGNILFDAEGSPFVTDFGLARFFHRPGAYTQSHAVPGTPEYLAPERINGVRTPTTASDIWSLGVLFHRLLGGQPPFRASSIPALLRQILEDEPTALPAAVGRDLRTICCKCLEKDPAARYDSAAALADDLDRWDARLPILARRTGTLEAIAKWVRRRPWQAASLGASLAALLGPTVIAIWFILNLNHSRGHHAIIPFASRTNVLQLGELSDDGPGRVTFNIPGAEFDARSNQWVQVEFLGLPETVAAGLKVRFRADWAVLPDPVRSTALGHLQSGLVRAQMERRILQDTFLYLEAVGWSPSEILPQFPQASLRLTLLEGPPTRAPGVP